MNLDQTVFVDSEKEPREDKNRCYYHFRHGGRDVSVCASNDIAVMRSVVHRKNELILNKFPLIVQAAVVYKLNGLKTEPAYIRALGIEMNDDSEAYDLMLMKPVILRAVAKKHQKEIQRVLDGI